MDLSFTLASLCRLPELWLLPNVYSGARGRCRDDALLVTVFGPPLAEPLLALLSFSDLEPLTRNPDDGPLQSIATFCIKGIIHIIMTSHLRPCALRFWLSTRARFVLQDHSIDESGSHKGNPSTSALLLASIMPDLRQVSSTILGYTAITGNSHCIYVNTELQHHA